MDDFKLLNNFISQKPDYHDMESVSDWFYRLKSWAMSHKFDDIVKTTDDGIFFLSSDSRRQEYVTKLISMIKNIRKENYSMGDTIKIFIVHGHDGELKESVARFLENQGLKPIILHEQANGGKTIIEKLECNTNDVRYAIILYTADDACSDGSKRARQNVIFEHGYLTAKLGRSNVCVIKDDSVEKPGDIDGIVYLSKTNWKFDLTKELTNAGIPSMCQYE